MKTLSDDPRAFQVISLYLAHHAAIVACACSLYGPRSLVGLTHRIHT